MSSLLKSQKPGHSKMFQAKIIFDEQNKLVLDNARKLKGSTYSSVCISRDLTHAQSQCTELYEKRKARRDQMSSVAGANTASGSNVTVDEGTRQHTPSAPRLSQKLGTCTPGICAADAHLPVTTSTTTLKIDQVNLNGLRSVHSIHSSF